MAVQPANHQITWEEFKVAFREHYIPEGVLHMKQEEFMKLQPNVNVPSLGKLCVTLDRYKAIKKSYKNNIKLKEEQDVTCNKD